MVCPPPSLSIFFYVGLTLDIFWYPILVPTVNHIFGHRYGMKVYAMLIQNLDNIKFFFPCLLLLK